MPWGPGSPCSVQPWIHCLVQKYPWEPSCAPLPGTPLLSVTCGDGGSTAALRVPGSPCPPGSLCLNFCWCLLLKLLGVLGSSHPALTQFLLVAMENWTQFH